MCFYSTIVNFIVFIIRCTTTSFQIYDNPDYIKARFNIFRRIWQWPMNQFEMALRTGLKLDPHRATSIRVGTSMVGKVLVLSWWVQTESFFSSGYYPKSSFPRWMNTDPEKVEPILSIVPSLKAIINKHLSKIISFCLLTLGYDKAHQSISVSKSSLRLIFFVSSELESL